MAPPGNGRFEEIPGQGELFSVESLGQSPGQLELPLDFGQQFRSMDAPESLGAEDFEIVDAFDEVEDPTSTTNPQRPRTLIAGYRQRQRILTVMFRDGTMWDYRGVSALVWNNFKRSYSKGWFLYQSGLDRWPDMGPSDLGTLALNDVNYAAALEHFAVRAQIAQIRSRGVKFGQSASYMERLKREDARIKQKGIMTPSRERISNPLVERGRKRTPKI